MPLPKFFTKEQLEKAKKVGIPKTTLYQRRRNGWSAEKACSTPPTREFSTRARTGLGSYKAGENNQIPNPVKKTFNLSKKENKRLDSLVAESGCTHGDYLRQLVIEHLQDKSA